MKLAACFFVASAIVVMAGCGGSSVTATSDDGGGSAGGGVAGSQLPEFPLGDWDGRYTASEERLQWSAKENEWNQEQIDEFRELTKGFDDVVATKMRLETGGGGWLQRGITAQDPVSWELAGKGVHVTVHHPSGDYTFTMSPVEHGRYFADFTEAWDEGPAKHLFSRRR